MTKSTETTVSALCVVATVIVLQGGATIVLQGLWHPPGSLRGGTTGEAFRAAPPPPPAAVIQKKQKPPVVAPPPPPPPPAAAAVIQKRQKPPVAASPPPPPAIKGPPPLKKQHPGIKDVWEPPARPVVGKPPARPRLPQNLGSGAGLAPERPEYASIDDTAAGERERPATARNRREAARVVGREEHWPGESVFVSIASYRDPECAKTVSRAFERAAVPERVSFGIFQQNAAADVDCVGGLADLVRCPSHAACGRVRRGQIRAYRVPWTETLGPTIARHLSERLYRNETYVMSFDAHTNFARGWDTVAIDMFKRIGNPRAIVTTYPASYAATNHSELWANVDANGPCRECRTIDDQRDAKFDPTPETQMAICRTRRVQVGRTLSFKHDVNRMRRPPRPTLVPFLAAGFNFARGERIRDVPYDAHSYFLFDGEETSLAVRAWTHGYDFYHPDRDVVSHLYIPNKSPLRPVFWTTDWEKRSRLQFWTMLRINYALGLHDLLDFWVNASLVDTRDLDKYGLGTRRRVQDYWTYAGISPHRHGPEWSPHRCALFETTGLTPFPVDAPGSHNDYAAYRDAFRFAPSSELERRTPPDN